MRRTVVVAVAAGVLAAGALGWAAWQGAWREASRPALALDPPAADFGPLSARSTLTITVRNTGRAPLRIVAVSTSCGCTTAVVDPAVLPAGERARLTVTFDPDAHGPETGPARHAVYLRTDDPRTPEVEVEVRAVVVKARSP